MLIQLSELHRQSQVAVGEKARRLGQLAQAGFPVPPGFVIPDKYYYDFLAQTGLEADLAKLEAAPSTDELQPLCKEFRDKFQTNSLSSELTQAIHPFLAQQFFLAVRSSAAQEDTDEHSFAGQYNTYLNITKEEDLHQAILQCWASLWSYRSILYRLQNGYSLKEGSMAVIVQQMVPAEAAGVLFTSHPFGTPGQMLIESAWGLGEAVVSGKTSTDSYVFDREKQVLLHKKPAYKLMMFKDNRYVKLPEAKRSEWSLTDQQAQELSVLASKIHEFYQSPQDIEWALSKGQFYLLQSRPITTREYRPAPPHSEQEKHEQENALISMMDIGESWTGIFTPLSISFAQYYQRHTHTALQRTLGIRYVGEHAKYIKYVYGRPYGDVSYFATLYAQCIFFRDQRRFLRRFSSEEVDLSDYSSPI